MSAFVCSDRHIATIAVRYAELVNNAIPQDIADQLKAINIASVNCHYDRDNPVTPCDLSDLAPRNFQYCDLVALCECLDYQSCNLPNDSNPLLELITAQFKSNCRHNIKSAVWSI